MGSYLGIQIGYWFNYQAGIIHPSPGQPPYPILWPTWEVYGHTLLRMVVGGVTTVAVRAVVKPLVYYLACSAMGVDTKTTKAQKPDIKNKPKIVAELCYKFLTYMSVGINVVVVAPILFKAMSIERLTYFTEL